MCRFLFWHWPHSCFSQKTNQWLQPQGQLQEEPGRWTALWAAHSCLGILTLTPHTQVSIHPALQHAHPGSPGISSHSEPNSLLYPNSYFLKDQLGIKIILIPHICITLSVSTFSSISDFIAQEPCGRQCARLWGPGMKKTWALAFSPKADDEQCNLMMWSSHTGAAEGCVCLWVQEDPQTLWSFYKMSALEGNLTDQLSLILSV